jgi:hypothetical protein
MIRSPCFKSVFLAGLNFEQVRLVKEGEESFAWYGGGSGLGTVGLHGT